MLIDIHTHKTYNDKNVFFIKNLFPDEITGNENHFSTGIHPWHIKTDRLDKLQQIIDKYKDKIIAIGEIGMDKHKPDLEVQEKIFVEQLKIASNLDKPVIIHCVGCFDKLLSIRKRFAKQKWIVHGFSGKYQLAQQLIQKDIYLSFGKIITESKHKIQNYFASLPATKIFLETDVSDLHIAEIYKQACLLLNKQQSELEKIIVKNFKTFFDGEQYMV